MEVNYISKSMFSRDGPVYYERLELLKTDFLCIETVHMRLKTWLV